MLKSSLDESKDSLQLTLDRLDQALIEAQNQADTALQRQLEAEKAQLLAEKALRKADYERQRAEIFNFNSAATGLLNEIITTRNEIAWMEQSDLEPIDQETQIALLNDSIQKKAKRALELCEEAIELGPGFSNSYTIKIKIHEEVDQDSAVIQTCNKAINILDKSHEFYQIRATAYLNAGQYQSAIKDYQWLYRNTKTQKEKLEFLKNIITIKSLLRQIDLAFLGEMEEKIETLEKTYKIEALSELNRQAISTYYISEDPALKENILDRFNRLQQLTEGEQRTQVLINKAKFISMTSPPDQALRNEDFEKVIGEIAPNIDQATPQQEEQLADLLFQYNDAFLNLFQEGFGISEADESFQNEDYEKARFLLLQKLNVGYLDKEPTKEKIRICQEKLSISFTLPTDGLIDQLWYLNNDGGLLANRGKSIKGADAKVIEAWQYMKNLGSSFIKIAIIDNGFDLQHPDLKGKSSEVIRLENQKQSFSPNTFTVATSVATTSIAAANDYGMVGVAPNATFIPIQIDYSSGDLGIYQAFKYCIENEVDVILCPWGVTSSNFQLSKIVKDVLERAAKSGRNGNGTIIIFPVNNTNSNYLGNKKSGIGAYASDPNVIAVGASTSQDDPDPNSSTGVGLCILAPSGAEMPIIAGRPSDIDFNISSKLLLSKEYRKYYFSSNGGTSTASAIVAGVCALILSENPNLTAVQVKQILQRTADKIGDPSEYDRNGFSPRYGYGRVNALKAVQEARRLAGWEE